MIRLFAPTDYIDPERSGVESTRTPIPFVGKRKTPAEWRWLARMLAALVDRPMTARDLVRTACRELRIGPTTARNALATADAWLLRFDHRQGLWFRVGGWS